MYLSPCTFTGIALSCLFLVATRNVRSKRRRLLDSIPHICHGVALVCLWTGVCVRGALTTAAAGRSLQGTPVFSYSKRKCKWSWQEAKQFKPVHVMWGIGRSVGIVWWWKGLRALTMQSTWIDGWPVSGSNRLRVNLSALFSSRLQPYLVTMRYSRSCGKSTFVFSSRSRDSYSTPEISWAISTEVDYLGSALC